MTSNETGGPISDMLALATRTADSGNDLAIGAGQIIAKRVGLGLAAVVNPMAADLAEFARIDAGESGGLFCCRHRDV